MRWRQQRWRTAFARTKRSSSCSCLPSYARRGSTRACRSAHKAGVRALDGTQAAIIAFAHHCSGSSTRRSLCAAHRAFAHLAVATAAVAAHSAHSPYIRSQSAGSLLSINERAQVFGRIVGLVDIMMPSLRLLMLLALAHLCIAIASASQQVRSLYCFFIYSYVLVAVL